MSPPPSYSNNVKSNPWHLKRAAQADELLKSLRTVVGDGRRLIAVPARGDFVVSTLSFSGVSSFFPLPFQDNEWLSTLGFSFLDGKYTALFERLGTAMAEVSAINDFNCATRDRAAVERKALENALRDLEQTTAEFGVLFSVEGKQFWGEFVTSIENIHTGKLPFARIMRKLLCGEALAVEIVEIQAFMNVRLFVLEFDALTALESNTSLPTCMNE